ncbi:hypothetical protein J2744_001855 [Halorubrum trapanicum]|uniref:Uncharacterized protein n=1 Tax=Halorubrum trapanicum TaxID=29284 RepID=A0A8J7RDZ1_9EURY|nr:hypothetical protein [Halorubrum trapanicum]
MFHPKQVVTLSNDPLANRSDRTAVIVAKSTFDDWDGTARYNVVCLTTDFDEYGDNSHTQELHKSKHLQTGQLKDHSLICPWATLAFNGQNLDHVTTNGVPQQNLELTDTGHELVSQTVYSFFSSYNNFSSSP